MIRRLVPSVALTSVALLVSAAPVLAHIDPDPDQAQAGSRLAVGFTVEHGCDGSPTTQLDMRLPVGVSDPVPETVEGWDGSVDTDDVEGTFTVTMTLPATPETTIYFPFVQRCEVGEIRWIGIPAEPGDDLDEPAPAMMLIGPVATLPPEVTVPDSSVPASSVPGVTEPVATDAVVPTSTEASADTTDVPSTSAPELISANTDRTGSSGTGTIIFIVTMASVVGLGAFVAYRARQTRAANPS
jgi:uncharacterized protein YcnI